jgi:chitinase
MTQSNNNGQGGAGDNAPVNRSKPGDSVGTAPALSGKWRSKLKGGRQSSKLVYPSDPGDKNYPLSVGGTEKKYSQNGYDPAKEAEKLSYTSGRVAKRVYNTYEKNAYKVFGYYTDWSQYDGRYEGNYADSQCGRGVDLMLLDAKAYDRLVIGFAGIVGDLGEKKDIIAQAAIDFGRSTNQATFVDAWGDVASYRNCGFTGWVSNDYQALFEQSKAQGVLGGLRLLKQKNPNLELALSLGGWTMSETFHAVAADPARRATLVASIAYIFSKFPMFSAIDLDWEYPGMPGNGNPHGPEDASNFQLLVRELKAALPSVEVSIAVGASLESLAVADIAGMLSAGVTGINLMTYDFVGTPWAPKVAHHTNLYRSNPDDETEHSIDAAVQYLKKSGVQSKKIYIGYAAYSRSLRNANISSWSPLAGTYNPGTGTTTGTFESGVSEYYDILYNFLDLEKQSGMNGFNVYTDLQANADYLYSPALQLYLSIDTPRSVKEKGAYVQKEGLGGLFTWTIEMDNGVLANAAREGLGNTLSSQAIDMSPFYFYGINVDAQAPVAVIDGPQEVYVGDTLELSGLRSVGSGLTYAWSSVPSLSFVDGKTAAIVSGTAPAEAGSFSITLTVKDSQGRTGSTSQTLVVKTRSDAPPVARITLELDSGDDFTLAADQSFDPDGNALTYLWDAAGFPFHGSTSAVVSGVAPTVTVDTSTGSSSRCRMARGSIRARCTST